MSDEDQSHNKNETDASIPRSNHSLGRSYRPSRRRLLESLTVGGSVLLSGCGQVNAPDTNATETETGPSTSTGHSMDQTFRAPTRQDPAKTAFYGWGHVSVLQDSAYAMVAKEPASWSLRRFLRQPGVWISGWLTPGPSTHIYYNWIKKPIRITPNEVTFTIRDDAKWSDGHPITGKDIALLPLERTLLRYISPPAYAPESQKESDDARFANFAFDDFEIKDDSVTFRSSAGLFDQFWKHNIVYRIGPVYPAPPPTHLTPFNAYADAVIKTARRAQEGEIYPWYKRGFDDPHRDSLIEKYLANPKYVRKFSKPENVVATGAWDLVELDGKEFVFEKNPHHRHADAINFERFILEYTPSAERQRAALTADRHDYATARGRSPTPQPVIDSLPSHLKYLRVPSNTLGNELSLSFHHPALGKRAVRQALMYALDQSTIAKNIHPSVAVPVTTPGGDSWDATDYVSEDWIDENLTTYNQDKEKAASLMQKAGYSKKGGQWVGADGTPLTLTLPTPSETPRWEPTVASQLSQFGIETTVQSMNGQALQNQVENGEFDIWAGNSTYLASIAQDTLYLWSNAVSNRYYGIFPRKQFQSGEFSRNGTPLPRTEERWRTFTIKAPPVGQPNGPLKTYHPAALALAFQTNPPPKEFRRRVKISLWLVNWLLPTIPINKQYEQHFIDEAHWQWPTDSARWQSFANGDVWPSGDLLGGITLRANPDNPEKEA